MSLGSATPAQWAPPAASPSPPMTGEARRARAFAAARRHSALVRVLRAALIVSSVGTVLVLLGLGLYRTFGPAIAGLSIGEISINGTKVTMDRPRLIGTRQDGRGYLINAAKAIQDVLHPTRVELLEIEGDIGAADGDTLHVTAERGHYETQLETMDLSGVVRLHNTHYTVELRSAHIEFKTGELASREPVTVLIEPSSSIVADSAAVRDNARVITFEGHVKTLLQPESGDSGAAAAIKGTQP